ncbi:hypothetical protein L208DRAFT_1423496 [Tricholoma matsutake]|nr:hypothetical protein L208DRAFT_1423496 [Tricholoma matsutake 945]
MPTNIPSISLIKTCEGAITKVTGDGLTGPNWITWQVEPYVCGEIQQPSRDEDLVSHDNWKKNDNYTKHLIIQNAIYEDKSQETAIMIIQNLWHTTAKEGDDISEHLTTLKKYWEHLNLVNDNSFKILEVQFKITIISSLPMSWDTFTQPYARTYWGYSRRNTSDTSDNPGT